MGKVITLLLFCFISNHLKAQTFSSAHANVGVEIISPIGISSEGSVIEGRIIRPFASGSLSKNKVLILDETSPVFHVAATSSVFSISILYEPYVSPQNNRGLYIASLEVVVENESGTYRIKPVIVADGHTIPGNYIDPGVCRVITNFN